MVKKKRKKREGVLNKIGKVKLLKRTLRGLI